MTARLQRLLPLAAPAGATLFLLSGPLLGATTDDEEYRNAIASLVLHARAVLDGEYPFWTSALGFGLPHPLHPTFFFHPLMPFFGLWPVGTAVRVLYALHGVIGAVGAWLLVRRLVPSAWIAGLGSATWVLATPALSYSQTDFWPSNFIGWSLAPFLLLWGIRVLEHPERSQPWRFATALGATAGFLTVTGHAGQQPALFLPLVLLCVLQPRRVFRRLPALLLATALGTIIASPVMARLMMELTYFPDLPRQVVEVPMGWSAATEMLLRPFAGASVLDTETVMAHGTRLPFFGGPMVLLALAYGLGLSGSSPYRVGLVGAFVVGLVMVFLPSDSGPAILPGTYVFRDPMVLTGMLMGCLALQALVERARRAAIAIGGVQIAVLVLAAIPFVADAWHHGGASDPSIHHTPVTESLQRWHGRLPGRWYLAPRLDELVRRGSLYDEGLWRDTWVYYDLPVVNGLYKGISADVIHPSGTLPLGRIEGHPSTVRSAPLLNLMGIGAVLAMADEPVADSLEEVARFDTHLGRPIRLLRNPGAWPGAGFVDATLLDRRPPNLEGCRAGILCLDVSAVEVSAPDTRVRTTRVHGVVRASFAASAGATRRLLVSEMYRPEWTAAARGRSLAVESAWDGLVVVDVPPGVDEVELRYRPRVLVALTWASGLVLTTTWLGLAVVWARGRRGRQAPGTATVATTS